MRSGVAPPAVRPLGTDTGTGPVVAMVHGLEDDWRSWQPLVRELGQARALRAARFRGLDLPWRSGCDYGWRRKATPSDWVGRGLAELAEPPALVIAHSFGANAVLEMLADRPAARWPAAVVLIAPFYRPADIPVTWEMFERSRANFHRQMHDGVAARLSRRGRLIDEEVLESMMRKTVERVGPAGFLAVFDQFVGSGELPLADVQTPTLVLAGAKDPGLGRWSGTSLAEAMPRADVVLRDEWDHFCHLRHTGDVADRITAFIGMASDAPTGAASRERSA